MRFEKKKLLKYLITAIKLEAEAQREVNTLQKLKLLLGEESAGKEHEFKAKTILNQRNQYLKQAKQYLVNVFEKGKENRLEKLEKYFKSIDFPKIPNEVPDYVLLRMLDLNTSPELFKKYKEQLEKQHEELSKLKSFRELYSQLQNTIDTFIKRTGNPDVAYYEFRLRAVPLITFCFIFLTTYGLWVIACAFAALFACAGDALNEYLEAIAAGEDPPMPPDLQACTQNNFNICMDALLDGFCGIRRRVIVGD